MKEPWDNVLEINVIDVDSPQYLILQVQNSARRSTTVLRDLDYLAHVITSGKRKHVVKRRVQFQPLAEYLSCHKRTMPITWEL